MKCRQLVRKQIIYINKISMASKIKTIRKKFQI